METGTVKFFNPNKRFGFLKSDITNEDYFVHVSGLSDTTISAGDKVSFDIIDTPRGKHAINIRHI